MGYASDKLTEAAAYSGEAATVCGETQAAYEDVKSKIGEIAAILSGLRDSGRAAVAGSTESGREAAKAAHRTLVEGIGPTDSVSRLGAWVYTAHQDSYLQSVPAVTERALGNLSRAVDYCEELIGLYGIEADRQTDRQQRAQDFIDGQS